ncbi:MAG: leucyl aminopeptidase [Polyangiaceae bacterium]|nr:leucyl aminopeptidase [Polyangiaceae bacterium]
MPLSIHASSVSRLLDTDCDVLALVAQEKNWADQANIASVNAQLGGALTQYAASSEFTGKQGQLLELATLGQIHARRVLLVGAGSAESAGEVPSRVTAALASRAAVGLNAKTLGFVPVDGADLRAVGEGLGMGAYRFTKYWTGDNQPKSELTKITVFEAGTKVSDARKKQLELGQRIAAAVDHARDAVNEPPNELYPAKLAELCARICKPYGIQVKITNKKGIDALGMKLFSAVGQGSVHEPHLIHMTYKPTGAKKKLVFVGKGLTFDSGGLCIKPAPGMGEMKNDMAGAAAVLGLMAALGELKPKVEVHGIIGSAENMPDGNAYRPGDIFGSLNGKTVEIINTDAEGRLVLADVLSYGAKLKPAAMIDAATLTGAMVVALGKSCTGFFSTTDELATRVQDAARAAGEAMWRMPLLDELGEQLKSDVADLKHTGERFGGAITAALFLREFVGGVPWVHCDIAGPAFSERARGLHPKGGTGHAVLTFLKFVEKFV